LIINDFENILENKENLNFKVVNSNTNNAEKENLFNPEDDCIKENILKVNLNINN